MWNTVIDPIGWSSKVMVPSEGYGVIWKIVELRPQEGNAKFDQELYDDVMNSSVDFEAKWLVIENWEWETAVMPVLKIKWANDVIESLSIEMEEWDISTAKHVLINS